MRKSDKITASEINHFWSRLASPYKKYKVIVNNKVYKNMGLTYKVDEEGEKFIFKTI